MKLFRIEWMYELFDYFGYRAANHLLRMILDGRTLTVAFRPPKEDHNLQPDKALVNKILEVRSIPLHYDISSMKDQH